MIILADFIKQFPLPPEILGDFQPWEITDDLSGIIRKLISRLDNQYSNTNGVAVHHTATLESGAVIKAPAIIGSNCFVGSNAYLREGVFLGESVSIGPGCEIKASIICQGSAIAHFNFIGDSIIGNQVNFEAGSVIANHYNERANKRIFVLSGKETIDTGTEKFGALVGDNSRIGANAVLSPGTILRPGSIIKRLGLIEQT
jgi:NDP-sugar pyrophosphorylase family protein